MDPLKLNVTVHDTPAALRFGGDGYLVTFAGTELDKPEAAKLMLLTKARLRITIELEDEHEENDSQGEGKAAGNKGGRRPWLERKQRAGKSKADG